MRYLFVKVAVFTILAQGTVIIAVPYFILSRSGTMNWPGISVAGIVPVVFGAAFAGCAFYCAWAFVVHGLGTPAPIDPPKYLVINGPYKFNRNPIYVSIAGMIFSESVFFSSWPVAQYAAVLLLGFHLFVVFYEEPHLGKLFGKEYLEYCRKVPRWRITLSPYNPENHSM